VPRAVAERRDAGPRAVAEDRLADTEDRAAERIGEQRRRLDVQRELDTERLHAVDPDRAGHDRGQHDLHDREVGEQELAEDRRVARDAALLQQEAEQQAGQRAEEQDQWISEHGACPPCRTSGTRSGCRS
jgi:hypothetical protein